MKVTATQQQITTVELTLTKEEIDKLFDELKELNLATNPYSVLYQLQQEVNRQY